MALLSRNVGATSEVLPVFILDSASTTGAGKTGLLFNSGGLTCFYKRSNGTASVSVTLANITTLGTYASGGFKEIDATNMPGEYEFHPPDAALASGAKWVRFWFRGAAGMVATPLFVELTGTNNQDAVRGGMTALPNANAGDAGGLLISGSNAGTTTFGALTVTGMTTMSDGLTINRSTSNQNALSINGNGTGIGVAINGGATGAGVRINGGSTSGAALSIQTISGDAIFIAATAGHGINVSGNGASKHGIVATGGTSGTSDGMCLVAGSGGVALRAATTTATITGNLTGSVTGDVQGKVLGGGASSITGTGVRAVDSSGNAIAPASTALDNTVWTNTKAGYIDDAITSRLASGSYTAPPSAATISTQVWSETTRALTDKAGFTISGTTTTFDALQTALNSVHGAGSWATATGFSTHSAGDVWAVATRTITDKTGFELTSGERNAIADAILKRDVDQVEGSAPADSLCGVVLAAFHAERTGPTTMVVYRTDDATTFKSKTITTDATLDPVKQVEG
jgi:hypothetical protein